MRKTSRDNGVENSNDNDLRRTTLAKEHKENLNPRTKYWRESLRIFTKSYEQRAYRADNEKPKPAIVNEIKSEDVKVSNRNGTNKQRTTTNKQTQKRQNTKKAVRWSKKS
jgi:hypothetical protein